MIACSDIVRMDSIDEKLAKLLGYKKILTSKDIQIVDNANYDKGPCIVRSKEPGVLGRALKRNNVLGIIIEDNELLKMTVEETKAAEKPICISIHDITCVDTRSRMRNLYRVRNLFKVASHSKAKMLLFTFADDRTCLLSSIQMAEIAKFIGASDQEAKSMLTGVKLT